MNTSIIKLKPKMRSLILVFGLLFTSVILSSCRMKAEHQSCASQLSVIDSLITHNQIKDASKELKKLSKKTYDLWSTIGIYKRYIRIEDKKLAEKVLMSAVKKNSDNLEVKAVYANFLIKEKRFEEACKVSRSLLGTKYGSFYSEAALQNAANNAEQNIDNKSTFVYYSDPEFIPIYLDAYKSSGNVFWLRDCAIINLINGKNKEAIKHLPVSFYKVNESYFWALAFYDAKKYDYAISAIERAKKLLNNYENKDSFRVSISDLIALESDCYIMMNDFVTAEKYRQELLSGIEELNFARDRRNVLPVLYMNSSLYAIETGNNDSAVDLLFVLVNNWPEYIPGLLKYADLAYELSIEREEDFETRKLREAGIKSLEMERYEARRKIPVSDAMYRLQNAFTKTKDQQLQLKMLDLKFKTNEKMSQKEKNIEIWKLLEDNITQGIKYTDEIVEYALGYFISSKLYPESYELFSKYMITQYDFNADEDFYAQVYEHKDEINRYLMEFSAWFALVQKHYEISDKLYKACIFDVNDEGEEIISPFISYSAVMNYANIRNSYGDKEYARDLYVKLAARERRVSNKAEIFYRLANIYILQNDIQNAKRAVDYAVTLYPDNAKAQLLKVKLSN